MRATEWYRWVAILCRKVGEEGPDWPLIRVYQVANKEQDR